MRKGLLVIALVGVCIGCTTAAKQALYTATGPQGSCLMVHSADAGKLGNYKALEVAKFDNALPNVIDAEMVYLVQQKTVSEMEESGDFASVVAVPAFKEGVTKTPTLVLRGTLLDMTSDKIPGQKLVGGGNHLIASVEVVDKATGDVLARGNVRGVVKSVAQIGESELAKGMARGIKKMFKKVLKKEED